MQQELVDTMTISGIHAVNINTNDLQPAIKQGWLALFEPDKALSVNEYVLISYRSGISSIMLLLNIKPDGYLLQSITNEDQIFIPHDELIVDAVAIVAIVPPSCHRMLKLHQLIKYEHCLLRH
jgi:hypothetical protein